MAAHSRTDLIILWKLMQTEEIGVCVRQKID